MPGDLKIYLIGFMGSGKTYWGRRLSQQLKLPVFDLDEQVELAENKTVKDIFASSGETYFRSREKELLHEITDGQSRFIMSCGGGAPCYFDNMAFMNKSGITIWLNIPEQVLFNRLVEEREDRPLLKGLTDEQLRSFITERLSSRKKYYEQAQYIIEDGNAGFDLLIEKIFHA